MIAMQTASKILIVGGLGNLLFGFLFGFVVSRTRLADSESEDYGTSDVHLGSLLQGLVLLGLALAIGLSPLRARIESGAALVVVVGSIFQALAAVAAWQAGYTSPFSARGIAYQLASINMILTVLGIGVLTIGAIKGL